MSRRLLSVSLVLLVFSVYIAWNTHENVREDAIPAFDWQPDLPLKQFALLRRPVLLRNTSSELWRARQVFNPQYFREKVKNKLQCLRSKDPIFMYVESDKPGMLRDVDVAADTGNAPEAPQVLSLGFEEFYQRTRTNPRHDGYYYYFTDDLNLVEPGLLSDITPWSSMRVTDYDGSTARTELTDGVASLWMGGQHVTTQCHYDASHNWYVQLYGRKRFTLFSPSQMRRLYLFPTLHPRYRKSRVPFGDFNSSTLTHTASNPRLAQRIARTYPAFKGRVPLQVTLSPGDNLFIPAMWFHHVEALDDFSMSINIFSESKEEILLRKIKALALPFELEWGTRRLLISAHHYLVSLFHRLGISNVTMFMRGFIDTKYAHHSTPWKADDKQYRRVHDATECYRPHEPWPDAEARARADQRLDTLVELFQQIPAPAANIDSFTQEPSLREWMERESTRRPQLEALADLNRRSCQPSREGSSVMTTEDQLLSLCECRCSGLQVMVLEEFVEGLIETVAGLDDMVPFLIDCLAT